MSSDLGMMPQYQQRYPVPAHLRLRATLLNRRMNVTLDSSHRSLVEQGGQGSMVRVTWSMGKMPWQLLQR